VEVVPGFTGVDEDFDEELGGTYAGDVEVVADFTGVLEL
jgi:hypothetical protein